MLSNLSKCYFSKIIIKPNNKILKLDNTFQNLTEPKQYYKSLDRINRPPPHMETIFDDPEVKKNALFNKMFFVDWKRYPDHNEVVVDLDNFSVREYVSNIMKSKFVDLEIQDQFPYRLLQLYAAFIVHIIVREIFFYFWDNDEGVQSFEIEKGKKKQRIAIASRDSHFNYAGFTQELNFNHLLFDRSIQRMKGQI